MCGITGYKNFSNRDDLAQSLKNATKSLVKRGPDNNATFSQKSVGLGHTRLSILDTSSKANQPMTDKSGRYTLVFNGEIYNYRELAETLAVELVTTSDTEVLLYLLIQDGEACLKNLNGFFAFAFYDSEEETILIARDRMGIKPLNYYHHDDFFVFGSEMKALFNYPISKEIDPHALYWYLRLTYLPDDLSMISGVKKLLPGHFMRVSNTGVDVQHYWHIEDPILFNGNYDDAKSQTVKLLEQSVERRMISDVPLGSFLSGGTDSSAVVSMASKFDSNLHTFSIGYKDHSFFDETNYAELVAKTFNTNHTTFSLTNDDLLNCLESVLAYIDEPFADSSAIPTYILSSHVSKHIKVALSGDGADELFGGYYKHLAFQRSSEKTIANHLIRLSAPMLKHLPTSRSSKAGNLIRRLAKFADIMEMKPFEKYWHLASFNLKADHYLLNPPEKNTIESFKLKFESPDEKFELNDFLDIDLQMVLPGDMLTKVDLMSMANSLEVRVPFLDKEMVNFARSLPPHYKIDKNKRKTVLQDAFEHILPKELHHRSKKGFEVPMLSWMRNELNASLNEVLFDEEYLEEQQIFNTSQVMKLKKKLFSQNPEDVHTTIWSLYVFQKWYKNHLE
ncbi:asparagine synthase (glutamine-hydrolyzing) [Ekhidna sp.]|uniref:asparagine synthase (glutamine-hydrolyzing) n=1 Tax=Ekhidna sp. TaxID=2608089 RepID=UPI0032982E0C